jgi:hypothetical protein
MMVDDGLFMIAVDTKRRDVASCSAIAFAKENPKMKRQIIGVALAVFAGAALAATPAHAQAQTETPTWPAQ